MQHTEPVKPGRVIIVVMILAALLPGYYFIMLTQPQLFYGMDIFRLSVISLMHPVIKLFLYTFLCFMGSVYQSRWLATEEQKKLHRDMRAQQSLFMGAFYSVVTYVVFFALSFRMKVSFGYLSIAFYVFATVMQVLGYYTARNHSRKVRD